MCEVNAIGLLLSGALTAAQASEERKQRNAAERWRLRRQELEEQNALQHQRIAMAEVNTQQLAEQDAAAVEIDRNQRAAAQARGAARVIASETGSHGLSYEALLQDLERQEAEFEDAVQTNLAIKNQYALLSLQGTQQNTQARLLNARRQPIPRPNPANYLIQGIGQGLRFGNSLDRSGLLD